MEDLDLLCPLGLLLLRQAREVELEVPEDAFSAKLKGLGDLLLCDELLEEAVLEAHLQLFIASSQTIVHVDLLGEQVEGLPEDVEEVGRSLITFDLKLFLDKYEVVDNKISDPLELIGFETALVLVPRAQVLTDTFAVFFNVVEKDCLRQGVGLLAFPDSLHRLRLDHI